MDKVRVVGKVFETTNYAQFKHRKDNRLIREDNVKSKMVSIKLMGQRQPITVDTQMFVTDGQHRLEALKRLNLPVTYIVDDRKMSTNEVAELQRATKPWKADDYAHSFAAEGNEDYKLYQTFRQSFPEFSHSCVLVMLSSTNSRNSSVEKNFENGAFKVKSYYKARQCAEMLRKIGEYYDGYNRRGFVMAILTLMDLKEFNFQRLLRKVPKRRKELMDFSKTEDYIDALQDVYNWKETKKVYFTQLMAA
jgi:hypothetical protein